jgi:hypothetical protein
MRPGIPLMFRFDEESSRLTILWQGLLITVVLGLMSLAEVLSANSNCKTNGAVNVPIGDPNGYCRAAHLPGFPGTAGSVLMVGSLFAVPTILAATGFVAALITGRRAALLWAGAVALVWCVLAAVSVGLAGVTDEPGG